MNQKNKLIGYYQWNMKTQPNRLPLGGYTYTNEGQTVRQESPSWVYKGEWNGTLSDKLYIEAQDGLTPAREIALPNTKHYYTPAWSPDSKSIAFLSKRGHAEPDRTDRRRHQSSGDQGEAAARAHRYGRVSSGCSCATIARKASAMRGPGVETRSPSIARSAPFTTAGIVPQPGRAATASAVTP